MTDPRLPPTFVIHDNFLTDAEVVALSIVLAAATDASTELYPQPQARVRQLQDGNRRWGTSPRRQTRLLQDIPAFPGPYGWGWRRR